MQHLIDDSADVGMIKHVFCSSLSFQQASMDIYMSNRFQVTTGFVKTVTHTRTAKIEIKLSQNVNVKTAILFSICDKKSTNQRREEKDHIFVTDVTYSKF